jgi:hypothetical protein
VDTVALNSIGKQDVQQTGLDWESGESYDMLDHKLTIRTTLPAFGVWLERLMYSFPRWNKNGSGTGKELSLSIDLKPPVKQQNKRPLYAVYRDGVQIKKSTELSQLFGSLEQHLHVFLAGIVTNRLLMRGSAVSKDGRGVCWLGEAGTGKSSMTMAMLERGYQYHADDLVVIDSNSAQLVSFPAPINLTTPALFPRFVDKSWFGPAERFNKRRRMARCNPSPRWYLHPEEIRPNCVAPQVTPIKTIFFPTYVPRAKPEFEPLTAGQAMRRLCDTVINSDAFDGDTLDLANRLVRGARCFSVVVNGPEATLEAIDQLL